MKKYLALLLCLMMTFSLFSCENIYEKLLPPLATSEPTVSNVTTPEGTTPAVTTPEITTPETDQTTPPAQETTTPEPEQTTSAPQELTPPQLEGYIPPEEPVLQTNVFESYEEILDVYRLAVERFDLIHASFLTIAHELGFANVAQVEWFYAILTSCYLYYPDGDKEVNKSTIDKLIYFTYETSDLNEDGIEELILMTLPQDILAVFSMVEGEPILLGNYTPRSVCKIDTCGRLHVTEKGVDDSFSYSVYWVSYGSGGGLQKLVEYGIDDLWFPSTLYYKEVNGKKIGISLEAYNALVAKFEDYESVWFSTPILFSSNKLLRAAYQSAIDSEVPIYLVDTGESIYLKDYTPPQSDIPLSKRGELKCAFGNVDGSDRMLEFVVYYGDFLMLDYDFYTGTIIARSLTDKEKSFIRGGVFYPLAAPWREVPITAIEIRKSVPGYLDWEVYDGFSETIGGFNVVHHILVSEMPDEYGYYLVTWQKEISPLYCNCLDCDFGIPHEVRNHRRMLIHSKTGEIIQITVTPQEARQIAGDFWDTYDGNVGYAAGSTYVDRLVVAGKPERTYGGTYYHVIQKVECYSNEGYQNGAEPYYVYDWLHLYIHTQTGECYIYPDYNDGK